MSFASPLQMRALITRSVSGGDTWSLPWWALHLLWGHPHLIVGVFEAKLPMALQNGAPSLLPLLCLLQLRLFNAKSASTRSPLLDVSGERMKRLVSGERNVPSLKPPWVRGVGGSNPCVSFGAVGVALVFGKTNGLAE